MDFSSIRFDVKGAATYIYNASAATARATPPAIHHLRLFDAFETMGNGVGFSFKCLLASPGGYP